MPTFRSTSICAGALVFLLMACFSVLAQQKRENLSVVAFGTSTQLGRTLNLKILIDSYSTPQDQEVLLQAFSKGGNQALVDALEKMPARGRLSTPGTVGYEVKYVRVWATPTGRKLRLITNRTLAFGEVWGDTRSRDYSISALELELNDDMNKSTGTLLPACQLKVNKQGEIEIETYQNPWRLGNFIEWK